MDWDCWREKIYAYVYRRTSNPDIANDLASLAILKAMEAEKAGKGHQKHFSGWLYRIAHNLVIDHYRARDRRQNVDLESVEGWVRQLVTNGEMEEEVATAELQHKVERALDRLTEEQELVLRYRADGYPFGAIADFVGKSEGAVKALLHRGRESLKDIMGFG